MCTWLWHNFVEFTDVSVKCIIYDILMFSLNFWLIVYDAISEILRLSKIPYRFKKNITE